MINIKLWSGRFEKDTAAATDDFNQSLTVDARMYAADIRGSIAHAEMLGKQGIILQADADLICVTLSEIKRDIDDGSLVMRGAEDIHMFVEAELIRRIGEVGKRLHTGRSRNDQVALDLRLYLLQRVADITGMLAQLNETLTQMARQNIGVTMPGYTHLQKAQPILLSHHLLAYREMFSRDVTRLKNTAELMNVSPLGSGALAGTTYPLDREYVAQRLGMGGVTANSLDAVSDRDFALDVTYNICVVMMHISRLAEEVILWATGEFGFVTLDDAYSTGSSIMPQKKNPDVAELARGKAGRVYGDLVTLLCMMKGLPLAYNKDMQEDKHAVFDAVDTAVLTLPVFTEMLATLKINADVMRRGAEQGYTNATDVADYLVTKGLPFRDAHEVAGKIVAHCVRHDISNIRELSFDTLRTFCDLFDRDVYDAASVEQCVDRRDIAGGTATARVREQL